MKDAFDYPEWFGDNANALWDMLTGYREPEKNNVLIFENVDELFKNSPKVLDLLLEYYKDAAVYWAIPNSSIGQEHGSVALNVILHTRVYDLAYDQYAAKKLGAMYIDRLTASAA
ncbi:Barstar (barnase inhibitor) [compost metagenome]